MAAGMLAAMMALATVLSVNTEDVSASTVRPIILTSGKETMVQLDNEGAEEKVLYTFTRKKLSYDKEYGETTYKVLFRLQINGKTIVEESSKAWIEDQWAKEQWKDLCNQAKVVITDIDTSDNCKDILVDTTKYEGRYRIQYAKGKVVVKESLQKMGTSLKLPSIVDNTWGCDFTFSGTKLVDYCQPYYKNGQWYYDKKEKNSQTVYQLSTTGNGSAKWAVCLRVFDVGWIHGTVDLKLVNNKLKLATKSLSGEILETGFGKRGVAEKKMTVYTTPGGTRAAYTVSRGGAVEFMTYKLLNDKIYIQVKNTQGRIGWISEKECKCLVFEGTMHA